MNDTNPKLISMRETCELTCMSRAWINKLRYAGKFPQAVFLGEKRFAFVRSEVEAWLHARIAARKSAA